MSFVFIWLVLPIILVFFYVFSSIGKIVIATKINSSLSAKEQVELITDAIIVLKHLYKES